jgi:hypothetical protein
MTIGYVENEGQDIGGIGWNAWVLEEWKSIQSSKFKVQNTLREANYKRFIKRVCISNFEFLILNF